MRTRGRQRRIRPLFETMAVSLGVLGLFESSTIAQICNYEVTAIIKAPPCAFTGSPATAATGLSPNGRYVCGYHHQCAQYNESFVYDVTTGVFRTMPRPNLVYSSQAWAVSDAGLVVGSYWKTDSGLRAYVYDIAKGQYTQLNPMQGGYWSEATAINANGVVCGYRSIGPGVQPQTAFIWSPDDGFTDLGLINGQNTWAWDINDSGAVVGSMAVNDMNRAFLWEDDSVIDLGALAELETFSAAINNINQVVGSSQVLNRWP